MDRAASPAARQERTKSSRIGMMALGAGNCRWLGGCLSRARPRLRLEKGEQGSKGGAVGPPPTACRELKNKLRGHAGERVSRLLAGGGAARQFRQSRRLSPRRPCQSAAPCRGHSATLPQARLSSLRITDGPAFISAAPPSARRSSPPTWRRFPRPRPHSTPFAARRRRTPSPPTAGLQSEGQGFRCFAQSA